MGSCPWCNWISTVLMNLETIRLDPFLIKNLWETYIKALPTEKWHGTLDKSTGISTKQLTNWWMFAWDPINKKARQSSAATDDKTRPKRYAGTCFHQTDIWSSLSYDLKASFFNVISDNYVKICACFSTGKWNIEKRVWCSPWLLYAVVILVFICCNLEMIVALS